MNLGLDKFVADAKTLGVNANAAKAMHRQFCGTYGNTGLLDYLRSLVSSRENGAEGLRSEHLADWIERCQKRGIDSAMSVSVASDAPSMKAVVGKRVAVVLSRTDGQSAPTSNVFDADKWGPAYLEEAKAFAERCFEVDRVEDRTEAGWTIWNRIGDKWVRESGSKPLSDMTSQEAALEVDHVNREHAQMLRDLLKRPDLALRGRDYAIRMLPWLANHEPNKGDDIGKWNSHMIGFAHSALVSGRVS